MVGHIGHGKGGFTLLELLVVIAIIAILAALLLPTLAAAKQKAQGISCMGNTKQMIVALHLYSDDANGWLPPNPDWATNNMWVQGEMEIPEDATNTAYLANSKLGPYLSKSIAVFKCPGDTSNHVRTYSLSQAVGTKPGELAAVDGPWLDGTRHHIANSPWRTYGLMQKLIPIYPWEKSIIP
jgi:prepilin-type N-terminal cleavage/methylation domain-containing protein